MGDAALFRNLTAENLVELYPEKLTEIHSYAKTEIIEFLAPVLNTDIEVDARCALLSDLRDKLCQTLCEMFPEYGTRELYNRRRPHTYGNDIYYIGNTVRNNNIDKNLKTVFKPEPIQNGDVNEDEATPDVSMIDQTDVIETCLLLRDSVVSLKTTIRDLQQEVTELKTHVILLDAKLANGDPNPASAADEPPTTINVIVPATQEQTATETLSTGENVNHPPHNNLDNFQLPRGHQKKIIRDGTGTISQRPGIVGSSIDSLSFSGTSVPRRNQIRSIYVGNCTVTTSAAAVRTHLGTIGLSESVLDIQPLTTRYSDMKSFCVTLNSVDAENTAYESVWPNNVAVRPYRPPRTGKQGSNQNRNHTGGRPSKNYQHQIAGRKPQQNNNKQYNNNRQHIRPVNEQQELHNVPLLRQQSNYMPPPVYNRPPHTWSGVYPCYNGQFMPLMSLPTTI